MEFEPFHTPEAIDPSTEILDLKENSLYIWKEEERKYSLCFEQ